MAERYVPAEIEAKWQARWEAERLYEARDDDPRPKWYWLTMFPYTSGNLHIGHWYAMAPSDVGARYKRMTGYNVMFPVGFDAFGLPAENAAISRGIHPHVWTMDNVANMRGQLKTMGASFDWSRELVTCLPDYYRWNQWFFLQFLKAGLAYRAKAPVNWCPQDQTTLANEQVIQLNGVGVCERCKTPVERRDMEQWFFRITKYADELLDFSHMEWPERVASMQTNWIGRSSGAEVSFALDVPDVEEKEIRVFTTRPDTLYGVTFMVLAPEHPLVAKLTTPDRREEVEAYVAQARLASEIERQNTEREKTGVFLGTTVTNRVNGEPVQVWTADYALAHYGTGAVMGVPAHDERDFGFAQKFGLPIRRVIAPADMPQDERAAPMTEAYIDPGVMSNSGPFDGTPNDEGKGKVADYLAEHGWGKRTITYRVRDWLLSRQRYWGTPIPVVYCRQCGIVPVPEGQLPVLLPEDAEFRPTGESPLVFHPSFAHTPCPQCGGDARRESDTMDTFVDSSWYHLRYTSPGYDAGPFDPAAIARWTPVDQYTGGAEHATMHLLYARFFEKALRDLGLLHHDEPYTRLFNQGQILGPDGQRMSKSRGNVVAPDDQVARYGADAFRAYLMFMGPWDQGGPFNASGISGITRWLNRVWPLVVDGEGAVSGVAADAAQTLELRRLTHRTIKGVTEDIERYRYNTLIAKLMEFTNQLTRPEAAPLRGSAAWTEAIESLILMTAPLTPHLAEELWQRTGHQFSVHNAAWPKFDPALAAEEELTLIVQVNGKLRDRITVPSGIAEEEAKALALASDKVRSQMDGKQVAQVIYVPKRLVNVVVR
ncbi:MAG: leucine--tRNA ligase [Chloroflexi bacterium]|nr:leucine--tRNA ligase [Chloroflexota bacterium]